MLYFIRANDVVPMNPSGYLRGFPYRECAHSLNKCRLGESTSCLIHESSKESSISHLEKKICYKTRASAFELNIDEYYFIQEKSKIRSINENNQTTIISIKPNINKILF